MAVFVGSAGRGEDIVCLLLQVLYHPGENKCMCSSYSNLSFIPVFQFMHCLPQVQWTVHTVRYSKTIGTVNRISNTIGIVSRMKRHTFGFLIFSLILAVSHFISSCCFITLPFSSSCSLSLCFYFKFFRNTKVTHGICFCGFSSVVLLLRFHLSFECHLWLLLLYWSALYLYGCQAVSF